MKTVLFIANPRSGTANKSNLPSLLRQHLCAGQFRHQLRYTEYAGHAMVLAREAVGAGYDMVVVCGGDGSVNEVAGQLIGTQTVLGVLPCGSGNGFAAHLGMGRDVARAIRWLHTAEVVTIDTCRMNDRPFVNLAGIGFDAEVARRLHGSRRRGFRGYFCATIAAIFDYKMLPVEIIIDGKVIRRTCLLTEVANAPVYGYGFSIVPTARFDDGWLEVLVVKAAPKWRYLFSLWRLLNRTFHKSRLAECFSGKNILIKPARKTAAHVDGEGFDLDQEARFSILPASLKVMKRL